MRRSRNKKSILYSNENKQMLVKLTNEIGYGKWSLIADALLLHGIECKTPQSMPAILKQLKNEEVDRSHKICPQLYDIAIRNCFKVPKINIEYKKLTGNTLDKVDLKCKLKKFFKRGIKDFISLFVRKKRLYSAFFSKYYSQRALKYVIKFSERDYPDQFMNQISQSCKQLMQFYKSYHQYISQAREYQYEYYKDMFSKRTATKIVDDYVYIAILTQIQQGQNNIEEFMNISPYIEESIDKIKQQRLYKVMLEVRSYSNVFKLYHEALNNYLDQNEFSIDLSGKKPPVADLQKLTKEYNKPKQQNGILTNTGALRRKNKQIRPSAYEKRFTNDLMREYLTEKNNDDEDLEQVDVNYVMQEQKLQNDPELMRHVLENYRFK